MGETIRLRMAKASQEDIDAAYALCNAFETLRHGFDPCVEDGPRIDREDPETCVRVLAHLRALAERGSLSRILGGLSTLLNPRNEIVDPNVDHLEHHPKNVAARAVVDAVIERTGEFSSWQRAVADMIEDQEEEVAVDHNRLLDRLLHLRELAQAARDGMPLPPMPAAPQDAATEATGG